MARPKNADTEATRDKILAAALQILTERGPSSMTVRKVASAAEVSVSVVSHHFDSRDGLLEACATTLYDRLSLAKSMAESRIDAHEDPLDFVEEVMRSAFNIAVQHKNITRIFVSFAVDAGALPRFMREETQRPFLDSWTTMLARRFDAEPEEIRFCLQSLVFLVARYAIASDKELRLLATNGAGLPRAETHIVRTARAMFANLGSVRASTECNLPE